jgi:hypothetical protein
LAQVAFEIVAEPAAANPPKGMPVFGSTTYHVVCPQRMWNKGHVDNKDRSDVIVEGYLEPRVGENNGAAYIAVVATALTTELAESRRQTWQLLADAAKAETAYNALRSRYAEDETIVQEARARMEKLKEDAKSTGATIPSGAMLALTGEPYHVRPVRDISSRSVAFEIIAGPSDVNNPPKGMQVFGPTTYHVVCPQRTWDEGHVDSEDRSDVIVEGYLEPRAGMDNGGAYVAVVATALTTRLRKAQQILAAATTAEEAYNALLSKYGEDAPLVQEARAKMERLKVGLARSRDQKPLRPAAILQPEYSVP